MNYVRLTKCQNVANMATPDSWKLEGWLLSELKHGSPVLILQTVRDGIRSVGMFHTSGPVLDYDEDIGVFMTHDEAYDIERLPDHTVATKLWLLRPIRGSAPIEGSKDAWDPDYDKACGHVVRAETGEEARVLANAFGGAETGPFDDEHANCIYRTGGDPWLDPKQSICVELTAGGDVGVVLSDFKTT
jgi:hypothetical protein